MSEFNYLNNINDQQKKIALTNIYNLVFNVKDFIGQWQEIDDTYKLLGFVPYTDNQKKINDYRFINDHFYSYISKKQNEIKKNIDDFYRLKELVIKWSNTAVQPKNEGWTARFVVYIALRNSWLSLLADNIKSLLETEEN